MRQEGNLPRNNEMTPYMQMVYQPMERRLDMAVYRACFASSARQARQFVVHGGVRVNGVRMRYPGYQLNPGDMFQCDPARTLWGLGENAGPLGRMRQIMSTDVSQLKYPAPLPSTSRKASTLSEAQQQQDETNTTLADQDVADLEDTANESALDVADSDATELKQRKTRLKNLLSQTRELIEKGKQKKSMNNATKQRFRALIKDLRLAQAQVNKWTDTRVESMEDRFSTLSDSLRKFSRASSSSQKPASDSNSQQNSSQSPESNTPTGQEKGEDGKALTTDNEPEWRRKARMGPRWVPRPFMSPFVFVPQYLQVDHALCAAVYLRHPVCGPGFAEVPTPFGVEVGGLAFNWYLRRRIEGRSPGPSEKGSGNTTPDLMEDV
ncbi:MAG: hypothetical protein Q9159_002927 [Coniocarpon cinnabarinum]